MLLNAWQGEAGRWFTTIARVFHGRLKEALSQNSLVWLATAVHKFAAGTATKLGAVLAEQARPTLLAGVVASAATLRTIMGHATPLDRPGLGDRVAALRAAELAALAQRHAQLTISGAGLAVAERVRTLARPKPAARLGDALTALKGSLDQESWRIERLARTEASHAYGFAQRDALDTLARVPGFAGLMPRWTEHVSDYTGQPLDRRVAADSLALHGQVVRSGDLYRIPPEAPNVPHRLAVGAWSHPPNRPNDRAVLVPWQRGWGPAWMLQAGKRFSLA
jgi:hypothetical protein